MTSANATSLGGSGVPSDPEATDLVPPWLAGIAASRWAVPFMALLSLLDACVSPILPEVMLVPLCLANPRRRWFYATWCAAASVVGAVIGYYIGLGLWEAGLREIAFAYVPGFTAESFAATSQRFGDDAFLWMFLAAFTPLPFKLFTVVAGVCHDQVALDTLVLASIAGRFPRFGIEVMLVHRFGPGFLLAMRRPLWRWSFILGAMALLMILVL